MEQQNSLLHFSFYYFSIFCISFYLRIIYLRQQSFNERGNERLKLKVDWTNLPFDKNVDCFAEIFLFNLKEKCFDWNSKDIQLHLCSWKHLDLKLALHDFPKNVLFHEKWKSFFSSNASKDINRNYKLFWSFLTLIINIFSKNSSNEGQQIHLNWCKYFNKGVTLIILQKLLLK